MSHSPEMPLTSAHWGTYRVETRDGRVAALHNFEEDKDGSPIGFGIVDVLEGPTRIDAPMVRESWLRKGPGANPSGRGTERFVAVSWDTAERLVAEELDRVRSNFDNSAIFGGSYGWASAGRFHHAQSQLHRFLNCIGGYTRSVNTYSFAAAEVLVPRVLGSFRHYLETATSWSSIVADTNLFVAFGGVPLKNGQVNSGGVGCHTQRASVSAAIEAGVEFVSISPLRGDSSESADVEWIAPRPCTDTALMLGIAHTLLVESLVDRKFLASHTCGYEQFENYLTGASDGVIKNATWAATITGLQAEQIIRLARRMAGGRTMISVSWSLTRQDHGEQPFWAAIALAAMLGQIGLPGGGIGFGYSAVNSIGQQSVKIPVSALPQGRNAVKDFIPVARISDMLLGPGTTFDYDGERYTYPDIRLVYWAGGNPFHHHQDLTRLRTAWQKPDTIIVHEWCWNASAKFADIVLPCTTPLERNDIAIALSDPYVIAMQQASAPFAASRNDYDIFSSIAERLNVATSFTEGRDETDWLRWIYDNTVAALANDGHTLPEFEALQEAGWAKLDTAAKARVMLEDYRQAPTDNPLNTPSGKIEIYSQTIADFDYADCPGHPTWLEPTEWLGAASKDYPLHLISNQPSTKLHSQLDHGAHSRGEKVRDREPVTLHRDDAERRGIKAGDVVRVFNSRGACLAGAVISEKIRAGVIQLSTGAWFDPEQSFTTAGMCKHGNPNTLTRDIGTSRLAQGPTAHSCLVEVEKYTKPPPKLTAFSPPDIVRDET